MNEQPVPETGDTGEEEAPAPRGDLIASYGARIHLRKQEGENLVPLTLDQLENSVRDALYASGYVVSVSAERID